MDSYNATMSADREEKERAVSQVKTSKGLTVIGANNILMKLLDVRLRSIDQILEHLFIGSAVGAKSKERLLEHGITRVVNVTLLEPNHFESEPEFQYINCRVEDQANERLAPHFRRLNLFIEQARRANKKVLVHCSAGMSRSATVVIAYLMEYQNMRLLEAYRLVKQQRSIIHPNEGFMRQLIEFERELFNSDPSVDIDEYQQAGFAFC